MGAPPAPSVGPEYPPGRLPKVTVGWIIGSVVALAAYLLGAAPSAILVAGRLGHDPTLEGSGNPGASNVYRVAGRRAGMTVLALDLGKGIVATAAGYLIGGRQLALVTGLAAVVGHVVPIDRPFHGGKGVAAAGGMALVLWPVPSVALAALFAVLAVTVRIASVGSIAIAAGLPIAVALMSSPVEEVIVALVVATLVIARHHGNIRRLLRGEERSTVQIDPGPDPDLDPDRPADTPN